VIIPEEMMNEESENIIAILQRLEKIEALLERMDRENRKEEARNAAFEVKWEQLMKEHTKIQEHVKENWERINSLEQKPARDKALLWDTVTGRVLVITGTALATAILTHIPGIVKLLLGGG
jgi:predicted RNase H-like nuclease (RuvC/YqgF family)